MGISITRLHRQWGVRLAFGLLGAMIWLPAALAGARAPNSAPSRPSRPSADHQLENYVIQPGDTLFSLARERSTTIPAIKAANGMHSSRLHAGGTLRLPAAPTPPVETAPAAVPPAVEDIQFATDEMDPLEIYEDALAAADSGSEPPTLRTRLVETAKQLLGIRYRRSGVSEKQGFDCSGLVQNVFRRFGIELARSSREQYRQGIRVPREQLHAGDLVFFSSTRRKVPNHVALYIGDGQILHALSGARKVVITSANSSWFKRRFLGARRMAELWQDDPLIADATSTN